MLIFTVAVAVATLAVPAVAAHSTELKFTEPTDLPALGLRIPMMPKAGEQPLPPPTTYNYKRTQNGRTTDIEMYSPDELWYSSQHAGKWTDAGGNSLVIGTVVSPKPTKFSTQHVTKAEYERKAAATSKPPPEQWKTEDLAQWAADFTGISDLALQVPPKKNSNMKDVLLSPSASPQNRIVCVFRLNPLAAGLAGAPRAWFVAVLNVAPGGDMDNTRKVFLEDCIGKISTVRKSAGNVKSSELFRSAETPRRSSRSAEFLAMREQVINSIRNLNDWWYVETDNYIILANLSQKHRTLVTELQTDIENLWPAYAELIPPKDDLRMVPVIRMFADQTDYVQYVGQNHSWSSGIFMPSKKELVIRPIEMGSTHDQRRLMLQTVYHEALHQYLFCAFDKLTPAAWFNEGHAVFFQYADVENKSIRVPEDKQSGDFVEKKIEKLTPQELQSLLTMSYEQFYAGSNEQRKTNYFLAWATVYYLRKGLPAGKKVAWIGLCDRYADALWKLKNGDAATVAAFEGVDMDAFTADFRDFWKSGSRRSVARTSRVVTSKKMGSIFK